MKSTIPAVLAPLLYLLACSPPRESLVVPVSPEDAKALQEAMDSLTAVEPCRRVWRADRGDSAWVCPDPRPPIPGTMED